MRHEQLQHLAATTGPRSLSRVYLCGPIAERGEAPRGGYQSCNRRTIDALTAFGVDVVATPYPHPRASGALKYLLYTLGFLRVYLSALRWERDAIVHITAMAGHFLYNELPLVAIARLRRCRVVLDLRAGAGEQKYLRRNFIYRALFRRLLSSVDQVLVEGEPMIAFVGDISDRKAIHFPNHFDTQAIISQDSAEYPSDKIIIAYVGRIVPEKGIETILKCARSLADRGFSVHVQVGGHGDPTYLQHLQDRYSGLPVVWLGPLQPPEVLKVFSSAHFFVFPTSHRGEGHSNALTEAMACGCVPVASNHGYNESVIGRAGVTLPLRADATVYAAEIERIWTEQAWPDLSRLAQHRIENRFSTAAAIRSLLSVYLRLSP